MEKKSRMLKSGKTVHVAPSPRTDTYRRFIPDARSVATQPARGGFWYKIWLNRR
jgi:hypothetical protein